MYYEYYCLDRTEEVPADYKEISFVCLRPDGCLELPTTLGTVCRKVAKTLEGFEGFHFHQLRHTYTSNLLANGAYTTDALHIPRNLLWDAEKKDKRLKTRAQSPLPKAK